jgi:DNA polymerase
MTSQTHKGSTQDQAREFVGDLRRYLEQLAEDGTEYLLIARGKDSDPAPAVPRISPAQRSPLRSVEEEIRNCRLCRLAKTRKKGVPGEGGMRKKVMFVGEGPGEQEDLSGRPFVGRAGKLLDKMIAAIGLSRDDVYITNIVKCRPPENRDPKPDEVVACWPYLEKQIAILQPRVIVTLGSPAVKTLLDTDDGISLLRGKVHDFQGTPLLATFHPAYLLRAYTVENRRKAWEDMKMVRDILNENR